MANILAKAVKLQKKKHQLQTRLLGLKGAKTYILKTDGGSKPFTILAIFDAWITDVDKFRTSTFFRFACQQDEIQKPFTTERNMRQISAIATHLAVVEVGGASIVYTIRKGDEWTPIYFDWEYRFYVTQTADALVPADNADV